MSNNVARVFDINHENTRLGEEEFEYRRNHILYNKKRGKRAITNIKKHRARLERRRVNKQLKDI